jgi:tRNA pseudouridine55 synthase
MATRKTYLARVVFGSATDTDDLQGEVIQTASVSDEVKEANFARRTLEGFLGDQQQMPPNFSAIKKDGVKAYQLARKGLAPKLEPRTISIHELQLLGTGLLPGSGEVFWDISATVSKGTYIRSLARDIGEAACIKAHLGQLRRTVSGAVSIGQAHTLASLEAAFSSHASSADFANYLRTFFLDPVKDLRIHMPRTLSIGNSSPTASRRMRLDLHQSDSMPNQSSLR